MSTTSSPSSPPFVIGIAGGSGSGKSTVTREVLAAVGPSSVAVLMQDDYYLDQPALSFEDRCKTNYDHPDAFDWPLLMAHVKALREGQAIEMPVYDFKRHCRAENTQAVQSAPIIVIEGLFALFDPDLRKMMSLKVFVDTAPDVRFIRRLQRDIAERGRSMSSVIEQYLQTVRPMHKQFIEPTKRNAHIILPHGANGPAVDMITTKAVSFIRELQG
jgi:uridine kinase